MKNCKHEVKNLHVQRGYKSDADGWGGTSEWIWYELACKKCQKKTEVGNDSIIWNINNVYLNFTGRFLDLKEFTKIFLQNKDLIKYTYIDYDIIDVILRTVGKRTDKLGKEIARKKKLIQKYQIELRNMERDFNGDL